MRPPAISMSDIYTIIFLSVGVAPLILSFVLFAERDK